MLRVEADARGLEQLDELGIARRGHADRLRASSVDEPRPLDLANDLRCEVAELWRDKKLDEGDARTLGAALVGFDEQTDLEGRMAAWWWKWSGLRCCWCWRWWRCGRRRAGTVVKVAGDGSGKDGRRWWRRRWRRGGRRRYHNGRLRLWRRRHLRPRLLLLLLLLWRRRRVVRLLWRRRIIRLWWRWSWRLRLWLWRTERLLRWRRLV